MTIDELRGFVTSLKNLSNELLNKTQGLDNLLYEVNQLIAPGSIASAILDVDLFVAQYTPVFESKMMELAVASNNLNVYTYTPFVISSIAGPGGQISPAGNVNVIAGRNIVFTMSPDFGFEVFDVVVDGVSVGRVTQYTFERVTSNHTLAVVFSPA